MIRVLIVDDSASVRELLSGFISDQEDMEVAGMATSGAEALAMVKKLRPDVVTMDIHLPDMDGFRVTRRIMEEYPLPIVIISSVVSSSDAEAGFRALDCGALILMDKPAFNDPDFKESMDDIIHTVRLMSEVRVVRRRARVEFPSPARSGDRGMEDSLSGVGGIKVVCIGVSTGGPQALKKVFEVLPESFPVPILVVQHMSKGFLEGMVNWLDSVVPLKVKTAVSGEKVRAGTIYFAPEDKHMLINPDMVISLSSSGPEEGIRPSAGVLFSSVARNIGSGTIGLIMTGMGRDGAAGLLEMRESGGYTIAQDRESSIVFGMPGEAVRIGAARKVLPLESISMELLNKVGLAPD